MLSHMTLMRQKRTKPQILLKHKQSKFNVRESTKVSLIVLDLQSNSEEKTV